MAARPREQSELELKALQRVVTSVAGSLDLDTVVERCLATALEIANANAGALYLVDERRSVLRRVAGHNVSDEIAPLERPWSERMEDYRNGRTIAFELDEETAASLPPLLAARAAGVRRVLVMPLVADRLIGVVGINFLAEAGLIPEETFAALQAITRVQAVAIENARVHRAVEARVRLADCLREFGERALAVPDQLDATRLVLETVIKLMRADRAFIRYIEGDVARFARGLGAFAPLTGQVLASSEPHIVRSLTEPSPFIAEDAAAVIAPDSQPGRNIRQDGTASFATLTMRHRDKVIGQVVVGFGETHRFTDEEIEALRIFSSMAAELLERERIQAEAEVERRRLDQVLEHLPMVVAVLHRDGRALHVNAAGRALALGGKGDWRTVMPQVHMENPDGSPIPPGQFQFQRVLRGELPEPAELVIILQDGTRRNVIAHARPLLDDSGEVNLVVACQQDVTALRELADAKDRFLRVASHELRSPIASLRATVSLLEMDPTAVTDDRRRITLLARVQRQVDRLTKLVEQLLDTARLNAREVPLERTRCELVSICEHAIDLAPNSGTGHRIVLEQDGPVFGSWDPMRLEQVVTNLLANALRYSASGTFIFVRARAQNEDAIIEVEDQGIGIPEDELARVFTPFFRARDASKLQKGGLGLGLHITQEIVKRHGGRIRVTSTVGKGSVFTVELPRST